MSRTPRPETTSRSERWLRLLVDSYPKLLNARVAESLESDDWLSSTWLSPRASDQFAEYRDLSFLKLVGCEHLHCRLLEFWPNKGPRWDALAVTATGAVLLVEAKAHIDEISAQTMTSANSLKSRDLITKSLRRAQKVFSKSNKVDWGTTPLFQMANRLAHLMFLHENHVKAGLVFISFTNAPDVPIPASELEYRGAHQLASNLLRLDQTKTRNVCHICIDIPRELANTAL